MSSTLRRWLLFAVCFLVLLAALAWTTVRMLRMESEGLDVAREAELNERVRLALWRLDAAVNPLLIRENVRPPHHFQPFHATDQAFTKGYEQVEKGDVLVPSPLLTQRPSHVRLYFEQPSFGAVLTSPQIPTGELRALALERYTDEEKLSRAMATMAKLQPFSEGLCQSASLACAPPLPGSDSRAVPQTGNQWNALNVKDLAEPGEAVSEPKSKAAASTRSALPDFTKQVGKNTQEANVRSSFNRQANYDSLNQSVQMKAPSNTANTAPAVMQLTRGEDSLTPFTALWQEGQLFLLRQAGIEQLQGVWIDWNSLQAELLKGISDLLPEASFERVEGLLSLDLASDPARMVAIPVRLQHGIATTQVASLSLFGTPLRRSLGIAWLCVLGAAASVATLLHGAIKLSERRGAFVSAVTHELRTPLTTFQLYTDLLAEGGIDDPGKRQDYLETLRGEAGRLSHLVENVLAYAQLEKGAARRQAEKISLGAIIDRLGERLGQRAQQGGMELVLDVDSPSRDRLVEVDVGAVEQILFNLVDNACKYAVPGDDPADRRIHLEAGSHGSLALLRVRDHGQGILPEESRRLFRAFEKSATQAAHSAPGVGLGLALCRRLSRALGGELRLEKGEALGASFVLELPAA